MSISRIEKPEAYNQLQQQFFEFRDMDSKLSEYAINSAITLDQLLSSTSSNNPLITELKQHLTTIKDEQDGLWSKIITQDGNLSDTFQSINETLSSSEKNEAYKKRFAACYWITQHYLTLLPLLKQLDASGSKFTRIESSLASIFQFLPRQALLINDLLKKATKDWPDDGKAMQSLHSLNRKYKRLNTLMDLSISVLQGKNTSPALIHHTLESNPHVVASALEASSIPLPKQAQINDSNDNAITAMLEDNGNDETLPSDDEWDAKLADLGNSLTALQASPPHPCDTDTSLEEENIFDISSDSSSDLGDESMTDDPLSMMTTPANAEYSPRNSLDLDAPAKAAIAKLQDILNNEVRPVRGGYFAGYRFFKKDGSSVQIPEGESQIRFAIAELDRKKDSSIQYPYQNLVGKIATIAITAEHDKPLFNLRTPETSHFYSTILETLNIDIDASIKIIRDFILSKDKVFWGTRLHDRPSTVNKILSTLENDGLDNEHKLKKAIRLAHEATENNSFLRSANTEAFYHTLLASLAVKPPQDMQTETIDTSYPPRKPRK